MCLANFSRMGLLFRKLAGLERSSDEPRQGATSAPGGLGTNLAAEDILLDVVVASKSELLAEIAQHMESVHGMERNAVAAALGHRERIASTGLGEGVAIPHARLAGLGRIRSMYLRLKFPIPFDAPDGKPVSDIMVLLVPKEAAQQHLDILALMTRLLSDPHFRERLHRCAQPEEAKDLFASWAKARA